MDRRPFLRLLGAGGIGFLVNSAPVIEELSAIGQNNSSATQDYSEAKQLARRVAKYLVEQRHMYKELVDFEYCKGCVDYFDKTSGKNVTEMIEETMEGLNHTDPDKVRGRKPEDIFDNIFPLTYNMNAILIYQSQSQTEIEVRIYDNIDSNELNWEDPRNYLRASRFDKQNYITSFKDIGIDGIVDESWFPFERDKQGAFVEWLNRIESMFLR